MPPLSRAALFKSEEAVLSANQPPCPVRTAAHVQHPAFPRIDICILTFNYDEYINPQEACYLMKELLPLTLHRNT